MHNIEFAVTALAQTTISSTMESGTTFGVQWPDAAQFAVFNSIGYFTRGRIVGSDAIVVRFFNSQDALDTHLDDVRVFEADTGTHMAQMVFEWDLGPQPLTQHNVDAYAMLADIANGNTRILTATHRPMSQKMWDRIHGSQYDTEADYQRKQ